jgi:hypothetical protein
MAFATVKGARWEVRVTRDLTDNWAVEVFPLPPKGTVKKSEVYKDWPVPLVMKVYADSELDALRCGLEHLKKLGRLDDYTLEKGEEAPPPPPPVSPAAG